MGSNMNLCKPRMVLIDEDELERLRRLEGELHTMMKKAREEVELDKLKILCEKCKENTKDYKFISKNPPLIPCPYFLHKS